MLGAVSSYPDVVECLEDARKYWNNNDSPIVRIGIYTRG